MVAVGRLSLFGGGLSDLTAFKISNLHFFHKDLKKFLEALEDLKEAEEHNGNLENYGKLKIELFSKLNSSSADLSNLTENYRKALEDNDLQISRQLESLHIKTSKDYPVEQITNVNPKYTSFSESVLVEETPLQGRYTVAGRDIKPGKNANLNCP